jgi:PhoPQ-activated pathogenicity-related protein
MKRLFVLLLVVLAVPVVAKSADSDNPPRALHDYLARPEPAFGWTLQNQQKLDAGTVYNVELTSQTWQGIVWKHALQICEPDQLDHKRHVLLFVNGGRIGRTPSEGDTARGLALARLSGARVAMLYQVPNQPLFDNRFEDDLITETWLKFLETGDKNWPLLFPMVKSAVAAMDAVQQMAADKWGEPVDAFVVTGASKRGWTSWLSAVGDKRVIGIAPMVIDVLNFHPQMKHQLATWGKYSEQIVDYTSKGLVKLENETPRDIELRTFMDPYTYRKQLTLPKLLINGTNDRYWVLDALNLYWDDLTGPKFVLYVPNAGHGLEGGREHALSTLAAFFRHVVSDTALPQLKWKHENGDNGVLRLSIESSARPEAVRTWVARSNTMDFREAHWEPQLIEGTDGPIVVEIAKPTEGHIALYGEVHFKLGPLPYSLCTQIRSE